MGFPSYTYDRTLHEVSCTATRPRPQALKEEGRTKDAERVLRKALTLDPADQPSVHVQRVLAQMRQQKGEHVAAIEVLDRAVPLAEARNEQVVIQRVREGPARASHFGPVTPAVEGP